MERKDEDDFYRSMEDMGLRGEERLCWSRPILIEAE